MSATNTKTTWTFASHHRPPYGAVALAGIGATEEDALRDALKNGLQDGLYMHESGNAAGTIPASGLVSLAINPGILGGKGGWVAEYRWKSGDVVGKQPYECHASVWIERGRQS